MASGLFSEQTCPRCGAKARHDAVACPVCGYWLRPMNYLPILVVVIMAAMLDIGLIVWKGVPRSALPISASELPGEVATVAPTPTVPPLEVVNAAVAEAPLPPSRTPIPTATMWPTATFVPTTTATATYTPTATVMPTRTATSTATSTATVAAPTPTQPPTATAAPLNVAEVSPTPASPAGGGVGGGDELDTLRVSSIDEPAATATSAPTATPAPMATPTEAPTEGTVVLHNFIGAELVVTVTSQDVVWATTFRIDSMGQTSVSLAPGRYTYTVSPAGKPDQHGDLTVTAGATLEVSVVG